MSIENTQITVTGRHVAVTDAMRDYAQKKSHHFDIEHPRILSVHFILDVEKHRHICEINVHCSNHIHIEATEVSDNMYASIDLCTDKVAQQMRKYKTRFQKKRRHAKHPVLHMEEHVLTAEGLDVHDHEHPTVIHRENYPLKPMYPDEAVVQMELSPKQFLIFLNPETDKVNVMYRRKNGQYGLIEVKVPEHAHHEG